MPTQHLANTAVLRNTYSNYTIPYYYYPVEPELKTAGQEVAQYRPCGLLRLFSPLAQVRREASLARDTPTRELVVQRLPRDPQDLRRARLIVAAA